MTHYTDHIQEHVPTTQQIMMSQMAVPSVEMHQHSFLTTVVSLLIYVFKKAYAFESSIFAANEYYFTTLILFAGHWLDGLLPAESKTRINAGDCTISDQSNCPVDEYLFMLTFNSNEWIIMPPISAGVVS